MSIGYSFLSYDDADSGRGKWDQRHLERFLRGEEFVPPAGWEFVEKPWDPSDGEGRVILFAAGIYEERHDAVIEALTRDLALLPWAVLIATSDECSTFPWHKIEPWPEHVKLWVMTPRPEHRYPAGTRFIGEGSPIPASVFYEHRPITRSRDMFFSGQVSHERREQAMAAMRRYERDHYCLIRQTPGFLQDAQGAVVGEPGADLSYIFSLNSAWLAPAPAGMCTQDSFRVYEALEAGCIPIGDSYRDGEPNAGAGYWEMLGMWSICPFQREWEHLEGTANGLLKDRHRNAAKMSANWQQYKRNIARTLHEDVWRGLLGLPGDPDDEITAIVLTSPTKLNPDLSMIQETIRSVRERIGGCEILVCCDGVRAEQNHMRDAYEIYLHELAMWCNTQFNVCPFLNGTHMHQSGLIRRILDEVRTPYVLMMEHDTPLCGDIDWGCVLDQMEQFDLNQMRFSHEALILDVHKRLFLDPLEGSKDWTPTFQFSMRPHVARTDWYAHIVRDLLAPEARTFVEDAVYGLMEHPLRELGADGRFARRKHGIRAWEQNRLALYTPQGDIKRSYHLDGRGSEPKYDVDIQWVGETPEGAPQPGRRKV